MRFLHTSDWHVGRSLHGQDLSAAHELYFAHLEEIIRSEQVDALLVAGDLFDRAVPSVQSLELLRDALGRLTALTDVVIIPGNHDSARRLGFLHEYLQRPLHILPQAHPQALCLPTTDSASAAVIYGLPYLDPDEYRNQLTPPGEELLARRHHEVMRAATDWVRADAQRFAGKYPIIVMAHAFVTGASPSDSERDIAVGGVDNVGAELFSGFDYVALGHLHRPQRIADKPIYYSGSPLPFSFSEAADIKQTLLVDTQTCTPEVIPAPTWRALSRIRCTIADLENGLYQDHADNFCEVTITDPIRPRELFARVKRALPHTLCLFSEPVRRSETGTKATVKKHSSVRDTIELFLSQADFDTHLPQAQQLLNECLETAQKAEG